MKKDEGKVRTVHNVLNKNLKLACIGLLHVRVSKSGIGVIHEMS